MLKLFCSVCVCILLASCVGIGPTSIVTTRNSYNEAIHSTSVEQLLLNIVRVKEAEFPTFADILETDSTNAATLGLAGGSSNLGAPAVIGALTGTATYGDSELVRLAPIQGYALIQQVSTPLAPASLTSLINSDFNLNPLLEYTVDKLTPGYVDYYRAQDIITILNEYGALNIGARTLDFGPMKNTDPTKKDSGKDDKPKGPDALVVALSPSGLLVPQNTRNLERGLFACIAAHVRGTTSSNVDKLWSNLRSIYKQPSANEIVLSSSLKKGEVSFFTTRSALGVLKQGDNDGSDFAYVDPQTAKTIVELNHDSPCRIGYFHMVPKTLTQEEVDKAWAGYVTDAFSKSSLEVKTRERLRDQERSYILIVRSPSPPVNAYAAIQRKGLWYWIDDDDKVSKTNFALLNQIVTIQAIPSQSQPLLATLPVK